MKSVGEAMAIGRTFKESLQKCLRPLETRWPCARTRNGQGGDGKAQKKRQAMNSSFTILCGFAPLHLGVDSAGFFRLTPPHHFTGTVCFLPNLFA